MWRATIHVVGAVLILWAVAAGASAQGPTINERPRPPMGGIATPSEVLPGSLESRLGAVPGTDQNRLQFGGGAAPISGGAGPRVPRAPSSIASPSVRASAPTSLGFTAPPPREVFEAPSFGSYSIPTGPEDEGPPGGLTLDAAIELLLRENLDLRAKFLEIPQAEADVLTAGLRANPIFYADAQLVPYGRYTEQRPGGQTQYDVNISYPFDLSGKRRARTLFAVRAKRVVEAQYQDAARNAIDQLYAVFLDVLAARQTVFYSEASVEGLNRLLEATRELYRRDQNTRADVSRVEVLLNVAEIGLSDAREGLSRTKRDLATLLNLPAQEAQALEVRGSLGADFPPLPTADELIGIALQLRPDLAAFRLGVKTAEANVRLQLANRFTDVFVLYQPYTFQDNSQTGQKSAYSWALGVTVPIPIYDRNQGGIARAKLNVTQSQVELARVERQVANEVQQAIYEYEVTRKIVERIRGELEPKARSVRDDTLRLYTGGEVNQVTFLNAQREYQDVVKQYLDTLVRHRRAMLTLNTVVGQRIFP